MRVADDQMWLLSGFAEPDLTTEPVGQLHWQKSRSCLSLSKKFKPHQKQLEESLGEERKQRPAKRTRPGNYTFSPFIYTVGESDQSKLDNAQVIEWRMKHYEDLIQ